MPPSPRKISREYDRIAENYDKGIKRGKLGNRPLKEIGREEKEGLLEIAAPKNVDIALDTACGTGRIFLELSEMCDTAYSVDISGEMLKVCKDKANSGKGKLVQGNFFSLPFKNNSFSLLTCLGATEYYSPEDIVKILKELERTAKPGGRIAITFQDRDNPMIDEYIESSEGDLNCKIHVYDENKIEKIVEEAGLKISKQERAGLQLQFLLEI